MWFIQADGKINPSTVKREDKNICKKDLNAITILFSILLLLYAKKRECQLIANIIDRRKLSSNPFI